MNIKKENSKMTGQQKYNKAVSFVKEGMTVEEALKKAGMTRSNYAYYRGKELKTAKKNPKVKVLVHANSSPARKYAKRKPVTNQVALIVGDPETVAAVYKTLI
jgi:5-bromo-4-chloroindolyl phosphate hydrolysis protein